MEGTLSAQSGSEPVVHEVLREGLISQSSVRRPFGTDVEKVYFTNLVAPSERLTAFSRS